MALPAAFLDELRGRTPLAPLIGRRVKLARSGRQWKGCCPFHDEKTPSFYVFEDGYHCFGCGAHGDGIGFVMQTEGASFIEAVKRLAAEAGLDVPAPSPQAAAAEQRRTDLYDVLEKAAGYFARTLHTPEGRPALDYLRRRGLSDATVGQFGLGWAGDGRRLTEALGIPTGLLAEAGLMTEAAEGRMRDLFFRRVTIPIRDQRGRLIGFGGRVLDDAQPKYLNGPETALFSKRRTLFGLDRVREAVRLGAPVVVVEGYLDVIALHQAGFPGAVAPLGTALGAEQLALLWTLAGAPVLCFDGDAAGSRAAVRAVTVALPLLTPEQTLRIARLPQGQDPDSLVRGGGPAAFQPVLDAAQPLAEALFAMLREGARSPEQLAAFRGRLEAAARAVAHPALAAEYRRALLDRFYAERRSKPGTRTAGAAAGRPALSADQADADRFRLLAALLLNHPTLLHDEAETVGHLDFTASLRPLIGAMLDWLHAGSDLEADALMDHLRASGASGQVDALLASVAAVLPAGARAGAMPADAWQVFWHYVGLLRRTLLDEQIARAEQDLCVRFDEPGVQRLMGLCAAKSRLYAADFAAT